MDYSFSKTEGSCPVCQCKTGRLYWKVSPKQAASYYVLPEADADRHQRLVDHISTLWSGGDASVIECDTCTIVYAHPYVAGDKTFYDLAYQRSGYPKWKWEFQQTIDTMRSLRPAESRMLEVGAGDGAFVRGALAIGFRPENILTTEYSDYGKTQIEKLNIACQSIDVRDLPDAEYGNNFDMICLFQVLEHLDGLDALFKKLHNLLKPGGNLFIAVPNDAFVAFNEKNGALLDMPPNHVGRWNRKSFETIADRFGFTVTGHELEPFDRKADTIRFVSDRVFAKAQKSGTLPNRIAAMPAGPIRTLGMAGLAGLQLIADLPVVAGMQAGCAQWAHLRKSS